jgi:hypothetical protein
VAVPNLLQAAALGRRLLAPVTANRRLAWMTRRPLPVTGRAAPGANGPRRVPRLLRPPTAGSWPEAGATVAWPALQNKKCPTATCLGI